MELLKEFQALRNVFASKIPLEVKDLWGQDLRLDFAEAQIDGWDGGSDRNGIPPVKMGVA